MITLPFLIPNANASTFSAIQDGNWDDAATWGGIAPPNTVSSSDTIIIPNGITVEIPDYLTVTNEGTINNFGVFNNYNKFINSGTVSNSGTFNLRTVICLGDCSTYLPATINNVNAIITNTGTFYAERQSLDNFGTFVNSNTVLINFTIENFGTITNNIDGTINIDYFFGSIKNYCNSTLTNNGTITEEVTIEDACPSCIIPGSGDLIITTDCKISTTTTVPGNVIVQNNALLYVPNGVTLNIDFTSNYLFIDSGSGVMIQSGGKIS